MDKKNGLVAGLMVLLGAYLLLPALGVVVGDALDVLVSVLVQIAPKVAVVSGILALILLCIPFTRRHAHGMLFGAIVLAVGAAGFSTVVAWLGGHSDVLTADLLNAGDQLVARVGRAR